jgi:hypothetical protein
MRGKCDPVRTVHYLSDLAEVVLLSALRESSPLFDRPINLLDVSEPRTFVIWKVQFSLKMRLFAIGFLFQIH